MSGLNRLKNNVKMTAKEVKNQFPELQSLNASTYSFWLKALTLVTAKAAKSFNIGSYVRLKPEHLTYNQIGHLTFVVVEISESISPVYSTRYTHFYIRSFDHTTLRPETLSVSPLDVELISINDTNDTNDTNELKSIVDHYGFSYVANIIGYWEIEEAAKERSLVNPRFWSKLQEAIDLGLIGLSTQVNDKPEVDPCDNADLSTQTIDNSECQPESLVKIGQDKIPSVTRKNHSENAIVSKQQLLFNSELLPLVINGQKNQTRRVWKDQTANLFIKAYRNQELIKVHSNPYNSQKKLEGYVRLTKEPYQERKSEMPNDDVKKEGFWGMTKHQFFSKFFPKPEDECFWVLDFEFIPLPVEVKTEVIYETSENLQEDNGQYMIFDYWCFDKGYGLYQKFATNNFVLADLDKLFTLSRHWIQKLAKKFNLWGLQQPLKDLAWLIKIKFKKQQLCEGGL